MSINTNSTAAVAFAYEELHEQEAFGSDEPSSLAILLADGNEDITECFDLGGDPDPELPDFDGLPCLAHDFEDVPF